MADRAAVPKSEAASPKIDAKQAKANAKAAKQAEKARKKASTDPADMGRMKQIRRAYQLTHEYDKAYPSCCRRLPAARSRWRWCSGDRGYMVTPC